MDFFWLELHTGTVVDLSALWAGGTGYNGSGILTDFDYFRSIDGSPSADTIILGTRGSPAGHPYYIEADGRGGHDRITGGGDDNWLWGGNGDDVLLGEGGNDDLYGGKGHDRVDGHTGDDTLKGGDGNDRLDGGDGADAMTGGQGDDVYAVDNSADQVVEAGSSGDDTVESAVSFRLPIHVEKLVLIGSAALVGRGNAGDNQLTGNGVANALSGGRGDDRIDGGGSNDQIFGGGGNDVLIGGSGGDRFYFNGALGSANVDRILDFSAPADTLYLDRSVFAGAGPNGTLAASALHLGDTASDADDRILYDGATGNLFYDADGTGGAAAILFATVAAGTPLTCADFVIYG